MLRDGSAAGEKSPEKWRLRNLLFRFTSQLDEKTREYENVAKAARNVLKLCWVEKGSLS
jgi:hypothetical protein